MHTESPEGLNSHTWQADNPSFILGIAVIVYSIFQLSGVWISQLMVCFAAPCTTPLQPAGCLTVSSLAPYQIRKLGKLRTLRIAFLGIIAVGAMLFGTSFVEHTPIPFFIVLLPFGVSVAAVNILGNILTSDTIDYDELHTGKRRESTYHVCTTPPCSAPEAAAHFPTELSPPPWLPYLTLSSLPFFLR